MTFYLPSLIEFINSENALDEILYGGCKFRIFFEN